MNAQSKGYALWLIIVLIVSVMTMFPKWSLADTLHAIVAGDTRETMGFIPNDIAPSVETDLKNIQLLLKRISGYTNVKMTEMHLLRGKEKGKELTRRGLRIALDKMSVRAGKDVVFFYYSGHGFRTKNKPSRWPYMVLSGNYAEEEAVSLDDVIQEIRDKSPRFFIVMADSCNNVEDIREEEISIFAKAGVITSKYIKNLKKIFEESKGFIIASASIQTKKAYGSKETGGFFTRQFLNVLESNLRDSSNPSWYTIMQNAGNVIQVKDKNRNMVLQYPQYEIQLRNYVVGENKITPERPVFPVDDKKDDKLGAYYPSVSPVNNKVDDKLVAYYPFNGNARDESGNNHHGRVRGAYLTKDRYGKSKSAYFFDGKNDYILIRDNSSLRMTANDNLTVSFWVYRNSTPRYPSNVQVVLAKGADGSKNGYLFSWAGGTFIVNKGRRYQLSKSLKTKRWYFITGVIDNRAKTLKYYVNGELVATRIIPTRLVGNYASLMIGKNPGRPKASFYGKVDDIRIYKRVLSSKEIQQLFVLKENVSSRGMGDPFKLCREIQDTGCGKECLEFCGELCERTCPEYLPDNNLPNNTFINPFNY
ncbi:LamG-like jellyroll fold domain-containing protein [Candidatus Parabeggiatoa sp. HSG14]|uniref:LamG-like jellyroll fold domain-containing protein n=1 Tax=Candidatus Parabeggiatoa sp. HSG14 TaxID=3055593 RepID=UPI0025A822D6|nr:caspase family protein [Thiotrichales bacterium HSG14]